MHAFHKTQNTNIRFITKTAHERRRRYFAK